jgi:hypothetical protein
MNTKKFLGTHQKKIVVSAPIIFLLLIGSSGILSTGNTLSLSASDTQFPSVGDATPVILDVSTKTGVNAIGGTITFSSDALNADSLSRSASIIDLWSEEPVISNSEGAIRFSGGIVGPNVNQSGNHGQVFTINFRSLKAGKTILHIKDGELLANNGTGENVITGVSTLTLYVHDQGRPSPDINGDGVLSISDINTLYIKTFYPFDARYDLNGDGKVDWSDVRMLIGLL